MQPHAQTWQITTANAPDPIKHICMVWPMKGNVAALLISSLFGAADEHDGRSSQAFTEGWLDPHLCSQ